MQKTSISVCTQRENSHAEDISLCTQRENAHVDDRSVCTQRENAHAEDIKQKRFLSPLCLCKYRFFFCVKCTSSSTSRRRKKNKNNNNNKHHHTSCGCGMCWWGMSDDMYVTTQRRMRVAVELVGKNQVAEHQAHLEMLTVATLAYTGVCSAGAQGEIRSSAPSKKKNPISLSPPSSSSHISLTPPSSSSLFYCCCANERFDLFSLTKTKLVLGIFVMMVSMVCCLRKMHKMLICFLFLSVENFLGAIG